MSRVKHQSIDRPCYRLIENLAYFFKSIRTIQQITDTNLDQLGTTTLSDAQEKLLDIFKGSAIKKKKEKSFQILSSASTPKLIGSKLLQPHS